MAEKIISTKSFYNGETKRKYLKLLEKRKTKNNCSPIVKNVTEKQSYKSCFGETAVWKYFHRQQHAIDYINNSKHVNLSLFAVEREESKRKFLVTTQKQFWLAYKDMSQNERHHYEVILQNKPCRLYFDIEYLFEFNPTINCIDALETFIELISYCLYMEYNITSSRKDFIDLDSSTDKKFSRHLILHLDRDEVLFENNSYCGEFLKEIVASLELYCLMNEISKYLPISTSYPGCQEKLEKKRLLNLYIRTENGNSWIFDQSVYSKNRNFRLHLSSKFSKKVSLQIADENQFDFKRKLSKLEKQIYKIRNLKFDAEFQVFQDTLVCPCYEIKKSTTLLRFIGNGEISQSNTQISGPNISKGGKVSVRGSKKSDYPALDAFVLFHVNKKGSNQGWIRRWLSYESSQLIIYDIDGNRYCGNIQREHKSNHTYYIADLNLGLLYQKCFDPDCWNYRSPEIPIPNDVNPFFLATDVDKENCNTNASKSNNNARSKDSFSQNTSLDKLDLVNISRFSEDFDFLESKEFENELSNEFDMSEILVENTVGDTSDDHFIEQSDSKNIGSQLELNAFTETNTPNIFHDKAIDLDVSASSVLSEGVPKETTHNNVFNTDCVTPNCGQPNDLTESLVEDLFSDEFDFTDNDSTIPLDSISTEIQDERDITDNDSTIPPVSTPIPTANHDSDSINIDDEDFFCDEIDIL